LSTPKAPPCGIFFPFRPPSPGQRTDLTTAASRRRHFFSPH
jgi:hypothetical protein